MIPMMRGTTAEGDAALAALTPRLVALADDLAWWARALADARG